MQTDDAVLRVRDKDDSPAGNPFRLVDVAVIAEEARVEAVLVIHFMIDTQRISPLVQDRVGLKLRDIKKIASGTGGNDLRAAISECRQKQQSARRLAVGLGAGDSIRSGCADARWIARNRFDGIQTGAQTIAFIACEKECLVLHNRPADRVAELVKA